MVERPLTRPWPGCCVLNQGLCKALLFDLDNTLVPRDEAFKSWLGNNISDSRIRAEMKMLDRGGQGCRNIFFASWLERTGVALTQELFVQGMLEYLTPNRDLIQALRELSGNYELGVVTNGGSRSQRAKMRATGLDQVFRPDRVWISGEVGVEKPDPRIFLGACEVLGVEPFECLYLGDRDEIDGAGAMSAGLQYQKVWSV